MATNGKRPMRIEATVLESHIVGVCDSDNGLRLIVYDELNGSIGGDVQGRDRQALYTALKKILRERNIAFVTVRGKGIRRAVGEDHTAIAIDEVAKGRRAAKRALRKCQLITDVAYNAMSHELRVKHDTAATLLAFRARMSEGKVAKQIEARVAESQRQLPYGKVLEAMTK